VGVNGVEECPVNGNLLLTEGSHSDESRVTSFLGKFPGRKGRECHLETGSGADAASFATMAFFERHELL
jgi:hypothetical protein